MKRILVLVTVETLVVVLLAPVALAITMTCSASPCYGTNKDDTLTERQGVDDEIFGLPGDDTIRGAILPPAPDTDIMRGGRGNDRLKSGDYDGRDELYGGKGRDACTIDEGDIFKSCEKLLVIVD